MTNDTLRFEIAPVPGESARACTALIASAVSKMRSRATWLLIGVGAAIGVLSILLPPSHAVSFLVGLVGVYGSVFGMQALARANARMLRASDPHDLETYSVEVGPQDIFTGCAHVSARYPWQEFTTVTESTEFYLFVRSGGAGVAIPKRILDPSREQALRACIQEWAPDRGAGLPRERQSRAI
jgi:hypothetical protein